MTPTSINKALLLLLVIFSSTVQAQEKVFDLTGNARLSGYDEFIRSSLIGSRAVGDTLDLPFFDDFSEPFSRLRNLGDDYPNQNLWQGYTVYVNNHMAINPISQGVATFDGLDEKGQAYSFGFAVPAVADSLTSNCIRMSTVADTAYLSFYYQAQGVGNAPEQNNPLVVEFKDTGQVWTQVWDVDGYNLEDFTFRRAMIPITDEKYLYDGFQFRFVNYASLSGNVDHWHVDYVELDGGRTAADTIIKDVSQMCQTSYQPQLGVNQTSSYSLLKEYSAMPWRHYKTDVEGFMGDSVYTMLRNNDTADIQTNFSFQILDHTGSQDYDVLTSTTTVYANRICGNELNSCNEIGASTSNLLFDISTAVPSFETSEEVSDDSTFFELRFSLGVDDDVDVNDVRVEKQEFYNYYAYDDGTAEKAYGLGELENVGRVAVKYDIKMEDDIRAIQLYLNPVAFDLSDEPVQLAIWIGAETPDDTLWTSPTLNLNYTEHVNYFYHYFIDRPLRKIQEDEIIWVGWIQQPATNQKFSIGMDVRTDNSDKVFYNLGTTWNQSSIPGSLMIRPVFGQEYDWVGVEETNSLEGITVYPNPSTGKVFIQEKFAGQLKSADIQVIDMSGRIIHQQAGCQNPLDLNGVQQGIYLLRLESETGLFTQRIVLQ